MASDQVASIIDIEMGCSPPPYARPSNVDTREEALRLRERALSDNEWNIRIKEERLGGAVVSQLVEMSERVNQYTTAYPSIFADIYRYL